MEAGGNAKPKTLSLNGKPESLTEVVYAAILDAIVNRLLLPGERVTESDVAARLQVSKTPVREAFLRLREAGLIEPYGGRGSQIVRHSLDVLCDAFEMREALESFTAEMAAARADVAGRAEIVAAAERSLACAEANDLEGFGRADRSFHRRIAEAANNGRIAKAVADSIVLVSTLRERDLLDTQDSVECGQSHVRIARAIADRKGRAAAREMRAHIRQVRSYIVDESSPSGGSG